MTVKELKVGILGLDFVPELPYPKIQLFFADVMEQNNPSGTDLRKPGLKIMLDRFVGMIAINMKDIDRAIRKVLQGVIESAFDEVGEAAVQGIMMRL